MKTYVDNFPPYSRNTSCDLRKQTNADRIRSMTDEELADFLERVADGCDSCPILKECTYSDGEISEKQIRLKWLKQECTERRMEHE